MMDMQSTPNMDLTENGAGSSDKETSLVKLRKKSYLKFFETCTDGKSRKCKLCKQIYSISTASGTLSFIGSFKLKTVYMY